MLFQPCSFSHVASDRLLQTSGNSDLETRVAVTATFPRSARLLRHADFERVYKLGRRHFSASMTMFYWQRTEAGVKSATAKSPAKSAIAPGLRIGFTVSRALGGAVERNRMKRRLREAVRMTRPAAGPNADVVINPKKSLLTAEFAAVVNEVSRAFVVIEQKLATKAAGGPEAGSREKPRGLQPLQ
jgi:ribonuclease P protein component